MIYVISIANRRFKYIRIIILFKNSIHYLLLVSAMLIKYIVKTKHMSIRTSKSKEYRKIEVFNIKLILKNT